MFALDNKLMNGKWSSCRIVDMEFHLALMKLLAILEVPILNPSEVLVVYLSKALSNAKGDMKKIVLPMLKHTQCYGAGVGYVNAMTYKMNHSIVVSLLNVPILMTGDEILDGMII